MQFSTKMCRGDLKLSIKSLIRVEFKKSYYAKVLQFSGANTRPPSYLYKHETIRNYLLVFESLSLSRKRKKLMHLMYGIAAILNGKYGPHESFDRIMNKKIDVFMK